MKLVRDKQEISQSLNNYTVYRHTSPSGKSYIGITKMKPSKRWKNGKGYINGSQILFERAILKYGWDNIKHEILLQNISKEEAKYSERYLIRWYKIHNLSYNITDGGDTTSNKAHRCGKDNPMYGRHETSPTYGKFSKEHPASKIVYQYNLDGTFYKMWYCMSDAAIALGFSQREVTHIVAACKGRVKTALGYLWSYDKKDKLTPAKTRTIYKYSSVTGELLGQYKNSKEAANSIIGNPSNSAIITCCNGKAETAYGYIWKRFKTDKINTNLSYRSRARQGYEDKYKLKQINKMHKTTNSK